MPSFREVSAYSPVLVIDAASSVIQAGVIDAAAPKTTRWLMRKDEAGVALFKLVEELGLNPARAGAFVYCDGPGSVLGIRTAAMALRTWCVLRPRPVFAYCSLALVAHALGRPETGVIADARRETWHHYQIGRGLRRLPATDVRGELVMPDHFRHWSVLPGNVTRVPYSLADLVPKVWEVDLLTATGAPDAFLHEEPSYVTWTPRVHSART